MCELCDKREACDAIIVDGRIIRPPSDCPHGYAPVTLTGIMGGGGGCCGDNAVRDVAKARTPAEIERVIREA